MLVAEGNVKLRLKSIALYRSVYIPAAKAIISVTKTVASRYFILNH